jgi:hypothetical protein
MENFFLSFMVGVLHRTNIYVNLKIYNYIKVEPLIPYTFMILLGHKSQYALCPQDFNMFCPQDLSFIKVLHLRIFATSLTLAHASWVYHSLFLKQLSPILTQNHPFISHFLVVKLSNHFSTVIAMPMTISITLFGIISNIHLEIYAFIHSITSSC